MSTLGQPGDFAMFLAEDADASPWPSFHTEYGFLPERNVVTVAAVEGYSGIMGIGYSRPEYLDLIAAWLRGHVPALPPEHHSARRAGHRADARTGRLDAGGHAPVQSGNGPASPSASGTGRTTARRRQERASPRKCSPSPMLASSWWTSRFSIPCPSSWRAARAKRACCCPAGPRGRWSAKKLPARELGRGRALIPFLQQGLGARIPQRSTQRSGMARELHSASPF